MSIRQLVAEKISFRALLHFAKCNFRFSKCAAPETAFSSLMSEFKTDHRRIQSKFGISVTSRPGLVSIN